jgi:hypothetical protein
MLHWMGSVLAAEKAAEKGVQYSLSHIPSISYYQ